MAGYAGPAGTLASHRELCAIEPIDHGRTLRRFQHGEHLPIPDEDEARNGWSLVITLAAVHGFAFYDRLLVAFLAPVLKSALTLTDTQLGIVLGSGFALVFCTASLALMLGGIGSPRRSTLPAAIALWSVATAACGLATTFAGLLGARMTMGLAQAALSPLALPMVAASVPRRSLGRAVAVYTSASTLGRSAAMLGGAFVLSVIAVPLAGDDGWRLLFALSALPNLVLALILVARRPLEPPMPPQQPAQAARPPAPSLRQWVGANRPWLAGLCSVTAAVVIIIQTATAWTTSLLVRRFGLTVAEAGTLFGLVILVAAPLGQGFGGWFIDTASARSVKASPVVLMAGALILVLPFAAILARTRSLGAAGAALVGLTFVLGTVTPLGPYAIQRICPPALRVRATAGLLCIVTAVGFGLGPASLGMLTDRVFGPGDIGAALFCVCVAASSVATVAAVLTPREGAR